MLPQAINRPFKAWDYELQDPSWRRWFDTLKQNNVSGLGDYAVGQLKGMFPAQSAPTGSPEGFQGGSYELQTALDAGKVPARSPRGARGALYGLQGAYRPRRLGEYNPTNEELQRGMR